MNSSAVAERLLVDDREDPGAAVLEPFFAPRSVAVIGASPKPGNQGRRIVESLRAQGYEGVVTLVHPDGKSIPPYEAVTSVEGLPPGTELAIAAVSARHVPQLVEPLAMRGIRHLIVISGGFSETGDEGDALQQELKLSGKQYGVRILGPNGLGVFSAQDRFNSFFLSPDEIVLPQPGPVAIISQSGAFMSLILDRLAGLNIGVHRAANFGNRVDVGECELIEAFGATPEVRVIGLYLESVSDGARFIEIARRVGLQKPVVVWKGGHAKRGSDAARAHSASLAGDYEVFQAACDQTGLIEVQGFEEFTGAIEVLSRQPPMPGRRTLIVSNGGGMGVFLTDLCEKQGLVISEPSEGLQANLKEVLPEYYSIRNPIDLTGSGTNKQCVMAVEHLMKSGEFDGLLMVLLAGTEGITPEAATLFRNRTPKELPVVVGAYGRTMGPGLRKAFAKDGIPVFDSAEAATRALSILVRRGESLRLTDTVSLPMESIYHPVALEDEFVFLKECPDEVEIKNALAACGVLVPRHIHLMGTEDLDHAIEELGFPLTLKAVERNIKHKTEVQGVRLFVTTKEDLVREWKVMSHAWPGAVWAEEQMPPGLDLMVGTHRDPQFGPVLVFGSGGPYVELLRDIERVILPAEDAELIRLVERTHAGKIIRGIRGQPELDRHRLFDFLRLVADWMSRDFRIESMDFNPVRLYEGGLVVLDAKITLGQDIEKGG